MARGDLVVLDQNSNAGGSGARLYNVALGTTILAGEPVWIVALGNASVQPAPTNFPDASAHLMVGIAATDSTNTATAAGSVNVVEVNPSLVYLIAPNDSTAWDTQAEYDALVNDRVLITNSATVTATPGNSGSYTLLASDSTNNGCVVKALDIAKYPAKVAIAFRASASILA